MKKTANYSKKVNDWGKPNSFSKRYANRTFRQRMKTETKERVFNEEGD